MTMACGSCGGRRTRAGQFLWTSADGKTTQTYPTEIQARAKQLRVGGTYVPVTTTSTSA